MSEITAIFYWARTNSALLWLMSTVSVLMFVGTLLALPWVVARIPEDYFLREEKSSPDNFGRHPILHHLYLFIRNLVGVIFILAGLAMLFIPGQGLVTILIGILLTTFPGKRRLVLRLVKQKNVLDTINWMRRKAHKPPLRVPPR